MSSPESSPEPELENPRPEHYASSLELKELASMFAETKADEETVINVIEDALLEPVPDLNDQAAMDEYNAKMATLKELTREYVHRSDMLKNLWGKIEAKTTWPTD